MKILVSKLVKIVACIVLVWKYDRSLNDFLNKSKLLIFCEWKYCTISYNFDNFYEWLQIVQSWHF